MESFPIDDTMALLNVWTTTPSKYTTAIIETPKTVSLENKMRNHLFSFQIPALGF